MTSWGFQDCQRDMGNGGAGGESMPFLTCEPMFPLTFVSSTQAAIASLAPTLFLGTFYDLVLLSRSHHIFLRNPFLRSTLCSPPRT